MGMVEKRGMREVYAKYANDLNFLVIFLFLRGNNFLVDVVVDLVPLPIRQYLL